MQQTPMNALTEMEKKSLKCFGLRPKRYCLIVSLNQAHLRSKVTRQLQPPIRGGCLKPPQEVAVYRPNSMRPRCGPPM